MKKIDNTETKGNKAMNKTTKKRNTKTIKSKEELKVQLSVSVDLGEVRISSVELARLLNKNHDAVLQSIEDVANESGESGESESLLHYFRGGTYTDTDNVEQLHILISKEGHALISDKSHKVIYRKVLHAICSAEDVMQEGRLIYLKEKLQLSTQAVNTALINARDVGTQQSHFDQDKDLADKLILGVTAKEVVAVIEVMYGNGLEIRDFASMQHLEALIQFNAFNLSLLTSGDAYLVDRTSRLTDYAYSLVGEADPSTVYAICKQFVHDYEAKKIEQRQELYDSIVDNKQDKGA